MKIKLFESKWLLILSLFYLLLMMPLTTVNASSELNFQVEPVFPKSQIEGQDKYFDLILKPGERDTLELLLKNPSYKQVAIKITAHSAFTNLNGIVEYGKDLEDVDSTLPFRLEEALTLPETITLAAGGKKKIEIPIQLTQKPFNGIVAGGLKIEEIKNIKEKETADSISINNTFSYILGIVVSNKKEREVLPKLTLKKVFADQVNYQNVISANIQNSTSSFVNKLQIEAIVHEKNTKKQLYSAKSKKLQMAPNSNFNYAIPLNGEAFKRGTYVIEMTARSGGRKWKWEETFTIDGNTAKKLNKEDVTIKHTINWWMIIAIGLCVMLLITASIVVYKHRVEKMRVFKKKKRKIKKR